MMMTTRSRVWRPTLAAAALVASVLALTGCGSASSSSSAGGTANHSGTTLAGDSTSSSNYQALLPPMYKGLFAAPTGPAVKAPSGKRIWVVDAGLASSYGVRTADAVEQAGKKLGWNVNVVDAKFDPNQMLVGFKQAVAAKAQGIIAISVDCPIVKTGAQEAKNAGIPVVGLETLDCDPSLYSYVVHYYNGESLEQFDKLWGEWQANYVIAKTNGQAKTILNTETDLQTTRWSAEGNRIALAKCPTCKVVADASFVGTELGPPLATKIQQAFIKNPEANSFIPSYDAIMTQGGGAQAIKATGRMSQLVISGGEGSAAGIAQIRDGNGMQACIGESPEWESYSAVDALVRLFLHRNPNELDSGNGFQLCDKTHNLPPAGQGYQPPVNFVADFYKLWGVS
jgi:ribose transport system substrate-binding protein